MKLRIQEKSLRLRVLRSELAILLADGCLEETINFAPEAGASLTYALKQDPTIHEPTVKYTANRVAILIPADQTKTWGATNQIGIAANINLGELGTLVLLVEKDFACLDRNEEDNRDTFENPNAGARYCPTR